jgi:hypothetical protein
MATRDTNKTTLVPFAIVVSFVVYAAFIAAAFSTASSIVPTM